MMYNELIKNLRKMQSHEYCVLVSIDGFPAMQIVKQAADAIEELLASCKNFESALKDSVEECETLQTYVDLYKDITEKSQKMATEYKQRLQKSEEDNVNLTGWLAEEHAKQCPHYIRNVHDRGDDSLCQKWVCEVKSLPKWIPVTERLPEYDKVVQITDGMEVGHGYLEGIDTTIGVTSFWHSPFCDIDETHITHWMPLPELPKEET